MSIALETALTFFIYMGGVVLLALAIMLWVETFRK